MLLADPNATPFDLKFRLFGTPVRVHPLFWLISGLFGWQWSSLGVLPGNGMAEVALWILCSFVSILLHEFGHVWMGRTFGAHQSHIVLHGMGGLAYGSADVPYRWQRVLVSAAGPAIQLLLFGLLFGLIYAGVIPLEASPERAARRMFARGLPFWPGNGFEVALLMMLIINLFWPLFNLLPIWPLDGGWITRDVCQMVSPRRGLLTSLWVSLIVSALLCANAALAILSEGKTILLPYVGHYFKGPYMALFFAMFAFGSFQAITEESRRRKRYWDDDLPWERKER